MTNDRERVLAQLLSLGTSEDPTEYKKEILSPGYYALSDFASLLAKDHTEEDLQRFLSAYPQFLMGSFGTRDDGDLALLYKPRVGIGFVADFGLLKYSQGGTGIVLVELELSNVPLFTQAGTPARHLQHALGQLEDWRQWIKLNKDTFVRDMVEAAKRAAPYSPEDHQPKSVRFKSSKNLQRLWDGFGGNDYVYVRYAIVIGRWANLSEEHRKRLIHYNQAHKNQQDVYTYDQIARKALVRPDLYEWQGLDAIKERRIYEEVDGGNTGNDLPGPGRRPPGLCPKRRGKD